MDLFFDSSGLVKRYIAEIGSTWVTNTVDLASGNTIFIAEITGVEVTAAIARRTRTGHSASAINAVFNNLENDLKDEYFGLEVTSAVLLEARSLARKYFLRGYDAIQLAVAVVFNRQQTAFGLTTITFVSADNDLLNAALAEGLLIENPNNYP